LVFLILSNLTVERLLVRRQSKTQTVLSVTKLLLHCESFANHKLIIELPRIASAKHSASTMQRLKCANAVVLQ
jgi:hypothetical protein